MDVEPAEVIAAYGRITAISSGAVRVADHLAVAFTPRYADPPPGPFGNTLPLIGATAQVSCSDADRRFVKDAGEVVSLELWEDAGEGKFRHWVFPKADLLRAELHPGGDQNRIYWWSLEDALPVA